MCPSLSGFDLFSPAVRDVPAHTAILTPALAAWVTQNTRQPHGTRYATAEGLDSADPL